MAVTVKVRVIVQALVVSACATLVVTALQVSLAATCVATLASVGRLAGLQPRLLPVGTVNVGGVESATWNHTSTVTNRQPPAARAAHVRGPATSGAGQAHLTPTVGRPMDPSKSGGWKERLRGRRDRLDTSTAPDDNSLFRSVIIRLE